MTHTWKITEAERLTSNGVVTNVNFNCTSEHNEIEYSYFGELTLGSIDVSSSDFVVYGELTQDLILSWVFENFNQTDIETQNSSSINEDHKFLAAQIPTSNGLPWEEN